MNESTTPPVRVLLIEDCEVDAMFAKRILESNPRLAFEVDRAESLAQAITKLHESDYDVALLDLNLGDAFGLESFDQIRALDARLPVVVLTGSDDEDLALIAIESGAQDFMAKGHLTGQMLFRALRFAIARQRKVLGFQAAADTDPLTGMPNRRHLESRFQEFVAEAQRNKAAMSLALLDVDHFKRVNDQYGHFVGDAVLKEVASILTAGLPEPMTAARFGGEEFALLMPSCSLDEACQLISSLLSKLEQKVMTFDDKPISVTASVGVVEIGYNDKWDAAYIKADAALYEAKTSGRNRFCSRRRVDNETDVANV